MLNGRRNALHVGKENRIRWCIESLRGIPALALIGHHVHDRLLASPARWAERATEGGWQDYSALRCAWQLSRIAATNFGYGKMGLLNRVEHEWVRPILRWARPSRHVRFGDIDISYRSELDGGGTEFGQQFIPFLTSLGMPKQKRAFEWCSGPGFIGFSMLGHGLCETLCLSDINPAAVSSCQHTVRVNRLGDRVSVYQSDNLKSKCGI
jgi:hypothetical protein